MKFSVNYITLRVLFVFTVILLNSCSKDSNDPSPSETSVTTSDFSKTMDENPTNGQSIGTVQGSTNEGAVTFSITEQNPSGAFTIDASSGELKVADEMLFDFETNPIITGTIKVANRAVAENASIVINLNDVADIYEGDVILKTQEEVNLFGANNYTQIDGLLLIGHPDENGTTDITDLSPLHSIGIVNNSLQIKNNTVLTTTVGLNVNFILGQIAIYTNPSLESIKGFENIISIPGIFISNNEVLTDVSGLSQITQIEYNFQIILCPALPDIDWLQNLTEIGNGISLIGCNSIRNINALSNLRNFTDAYGSIRIQNNTSLENLDGLQYFSDDIAFLDIIGNTALQNIQGLENIGVFQELAINNNESLQSLDGLGAITAVNNGIEIRNNNSLTDLQGINNLERAGNSFLVQDNESLTSLNGLEGLESFVYIRCYNNMLLTDFCTLRSVLTLHSNFGFIAESNAYNPTKQDIIDGNCSL
ncbi:cadherin repeat domain-containing protein [Aequorivita sp. CIP111184]|uniref:cadherin repeat domain-containing protein n=1 Tax=Aequorivita sp. CIP111184 TaxID=2211356 RepID=UPI000DBBF920|nr:cadherin repeat domain-containing protein [Aequorivita sp. CIP111184]SRX55591.1 hypothetical protein AEQU1_02615 [Aequorivita sp. CIP111184]